MKVCLISECESTKIEGRGLCSKHYQDARSKGYLEEVGWKEDRKCKNCDLPFTAYKTGNIFCGSACAHQYRYRTERRGEVSERPCEWCGATVGLDRRTDTRFCNDECQKNDHNRRTSEKLWEERSANRIGKKCLACEILLPEHKQKNSDYCTFECKVQARNLRKYGITVPEYKAILAAQDGVCKICKSDDFGANRQAAVDHDHKTGKVRGLLCMNCNNGLGRFKDDPDLLLAAVEYLKEDVC